MNHYKDELLYLIKDWTVSQLDVYIKELEERVTHIKQQLAEMRAMRKRKLRNQDLKDNGPRGGM